MVLPGAPSPLFALFTFGLVRLLILAASLILTTAAAAFFLTVSLFLKGELYWLQEDPLTLGGSIIFFATAWFLIALNGGLITLFAMIVTEFLKLRTLIVHLMIGALVGAIIMFRSEGHDYFGRPLPFTDQEFWLAACAAGIVAGVVHWLVAGHRAGRWIESANPPLPPETNAPR